MGSFHFTEVQVGYPQPFPHREMCCIVIGDQVSDAGSVFPDLMLSGPYSLAVLHVR